MLLGDVVICPAVAARNAPEHAGTYDDELALLVVHGVLHLLGMDHDDDDEAEAMEQRERELLAKFHGAGSEGTEVPAAAPSPTLAPEPTRGRRAGVAATVRLASTSLTLRPDLVAGSWCCSCSSAGLRAWPRPR